MIGGVIEIEPMDKKTYEKYKRRIGSAVPQIDNKPPKFNVSTYYKPRNLEADATRMKEIDEQNIKLLKRLNIINRLHGTVDCWMGYVRYKSNIDKQETENRKIRKMNKMVLKKIRDAVSFYPAAGLIRSWKMLKMKSIHSSRYPPQLKDKSFTSKEERDYCMIKDVSLIKDLNPSIRSKCFIDVQVVGSDQKLGKIVIELYDDIVPQTSANFAELCRGSNGLSYKNTPFHRIVSGFWCQGGDVTKFNGCGGSSIYGESFENENYHLRHAGPGILSMCSNNDNKCDSKFNLTFRRLETVNEREVVFGKVISGLSNIYKIEECGTKTGKPIKKVIISNCGVLTTKYGRQSVGKQKKTSFASNN